MGAGTAGREQGVCVVLPGPRRPRPLVEWGEPYAVYLLVGGLLYLAGAILVTIAYHVPRNDALATVDPDSPDAARRWARYVRSWTAANHVRTVAPLAAATLLTIALRVN